MATASKWPKTFPPLTPGQVVISDDFMKYWHEVLPKRFGMIDKFNHGVVVEDAGEFTRTLEIGAGLGEHLDYERLTPAQEREYVANDIRANMLAQLHERFPKVQTVLGDCQKGFDFPDGHFDRVLAIHVLEHLPNLPAAVRELHRVMDKKKGFLQVVIPCEGSLAYTLARRISAQRIFEKRYKQPYRWFIEREHVNVPSEILGELREKFEIQSTRYWPFPIPLEMANLVIALRCVPKQ